MPLDGYTLAERDVGRLKALLDAFESGRLNPRLDPRAAANTGPLWTRIGQVVGSGGIPARVGNTPGYGSVAIQRIDGAILDQSLSLAVEGAYNIGTTAIVPGDYVGLGREPWSGKNFAASLSKLSSDIRTYVSNVCPIFQMLTFSTGSGQTTVRLQIGETVEFTIEDLATGTILDVYCVTNPVGCCAVGSGSWGSLGSLGSNGMGSFGSGNGICTCCTDPCLSPILCVTINTPPTLTSPCLNDQDGLNWNVEASCLNCAVWAATYTGSYWSPWQNGFFCYDAYNNLIEFNPSLACVNGQLILTVVIGWERPLPLGTIGCKAVYQGAIGCSLGAVTIPQIQTNGCSCWGPALTVTVANGVGIPCMPSGGCGSGGSGGSSGGCNPSPTALGEAASAGPVSSFTMGAITVNAGELLCVAVGVSGGSGVTCTYDGVAMNSDIGAALLSPTGAAVYIFYLRVPGLTLGNIVATLTGGTALILMSAVAVSGLTGTGDQIASASGSASHPATGTTGATSQACEFAFAAVLMEGTALTGWSWGNGFTSTGQDISDGTSPTYYLVTGDRILTSIAGVDATLSGVTPTQWGACVETFS